MDTPPDPFIESVGSPTDSTHWAAEYSRNFGSGGGWSLLPSVVEGQKAVSDDRSMITLPPHATAAIIEAVQRAIIDKGASRATRKAAFSAMLALVDAGLIKGNLSANSPARVEASVAQAHESARWLLAGQG